MRKYRWIFKCILLCICLSGCSSSVQKGEETQNADQFYGKSVILKELGTDEKAERDEKSLDVIHSWKEWDSLSESLTEKERSKCSYDEAFFEDKDLLLISYVAENENRYALKQMELTGESLQINMIKKEKRFPGFSIYGSEDVLILRKQGLLIEVDKGSVPKDAYLTLIMEEGTYDERIGYISGVQKRAEEMTLEFDEAEWVRDEMQPDRARHVSKNEAVKIYNLGEDVQYIVSTSGMNSYNKTHDRKLEEKGSVQEGVELEETAFMEYVAYINQSDRQGSAAFWITIDEEQVVMVREEGTYE